LPLVARAALTGKGVSLIQVQMADTVAAAVMRSIRRGEIDPVHAGREGIAYKAALHRAGANLDALCSDAVRDALVMQRAVLARAGRS
jgi:hypothetical protein